MDVENIGGLNLYTYCNNNPIKFIRSRNISILGKSNFDNILSFQWPDLSIMSDAFGIIENTFSAIAGTIDGIRQIKKLSKFTGLDKASNVLMGVGIALNVGLSIYDNLTTDGLSIAQRLGNIVGDITYIGISSTIAWGSAALVAMIPFAGPFLAPIVSIGLGFIFDKIWYGDWFKINDKSIDQHIKSFFSWIFGGCK